MSDLEQIIDGAEPEEATTPEPETEPVVEAEAEAPEAETEEAPVEPKQDETVPLAALLEVRKELRDLKSLAAPAPPPTPAPDVFQDPEGYSQHMRHQVEAATRSTKLEMSRFMAEREFGADKVEAMMEHFNAHPEQTQTFLNKPSPFHAAMEQYNAQMVAQQIGSDPEAYKQSLKAELMAEIQAEMVAKQAKEKAAAVAPSMANVNGTGGGPKSAWTGPTEISSILPE